MTVAQVSEYLPLAASVAKRYTPLPGTGLDRADLTMEALSDLFRRRGDFDPQKGRWVTFAQRVILGRIQHVMRDAKVFDSLDVYLAAGITPASLTTGADDLVDGVIREMAASTLWRAVYGLPEPFRTVIVRHYRDGAEVADIAREMAMSKTAVRDRRDSGLEILRVRLRADRDLLVGGLL